MASAAPPIPSWQAKLVAHLARGLAWFLPVLVTALLTAWLSYAYNQKANSELVAQQLRISDLQQFRSSSAALDQALSGLSDALVDSQTGEDKSGSGIAAARKDMRQAITKNLSDAIAAKEVLGPATSAYMAGLADLRTTVDQVDNFDAGQVLWQKSLNLMKMRQRLIAGAQSRTRL